MPFLLTTENSSTPFETQLNCHLFQEACQNVWRVWDFPCKGTSEPSTVSWLPAEKSDSWVRDKGLHCWPHRSSMSFMSVTAPLTPKSQGATWRGPGESSVCSRCASQLTNVRLRAPKSHIMDCSKPSLCQGGSAVSVFQGCSACCTNILEKRVWNQRAISASAYKMCRNSRNQEGWFPDKTFPGYLIQHSHNAPTMLCPPLPEKTRMNPCCNDLFTFLFHHWPGSSLLLGTIFYIYLPDTH